MQLFLGTLPIILRLFSKVRGHLLFSNYSWNNLPEPTGSILVVPPAAPSHKHAVQPTISLGPPSLLYLNGTTVPCPRGDRACNRGRWFEICSETKFGVEDCLRIGSKEWRTCKQWLQKRARRIPWWRSGSIWINFVKDKLYNSLLQPYWLAARLCWSG